MHTITLTRHIPMQIPLTAVISYLASKLVVRKMVLNLLSKVVILVAGVPPPRPLQSPISGPLPWAYTGYNTFPAFYFGSRPEGLQSENTLALIANFSLAGWGWEQGLGGRCESCNGWHPTGPLGNLSYCNSEQRLSETATRFRAYLTWGPPSFSQHEKQHDPATKPLFVYRNTVLALHFMSIQRAAYSRPDLFLHGPDGQVCRHSRNGSPFWNFSNPAARTFFVEQVVAGAAREAGSNLIFFDGWDGPYCGLTNDPTTYHGSTAGSSCGSSVVFTLSQLRDEVAVVLGMLVEAAQVLNAAGKAPIFSMVNRFVTPDTRDARHWANGTYGDGPRW